MKSYYDLLSLAPEATLDEIKRAFRREIARYHPDKVTHLGPEFLQIAETRAAELTEAYRILMDPIARAQYDGQSPGSARGGVSAAPPAPEAEPRPVDHAGARQPPPSPPPAFGFKEERATRDEFVRRAAIARFREAAVAALGQVESAAVRGFDAGFTARPRRALFGKSAPQSRVLARFVSRVDAEAVDETWTLALKSAPAAGVGTSVFLMGGGLAPAPELAARIADLKKRPARGAAVPLLVPVDVRDWEAFVPTDASPAVRAILDKLKRPS